MNREAIYAAMFSLLSAIPNVAVCSRKLKHWNDVQEFPAIFQAQRHEVALKTGRGTPTRWTFILDIYIYVKVSENELSSTDLNLQLDAVTNALLPNQNIENRQTLGGLVHDCWIDGQIETDEGTLGVIGVAIIPVHIMVAP